MKPVSSASARFWGP